MAQPVTVSARSTSIQRRADRDSNVERIHHSRFDGSATESLLAFVKRRMLALPEGCIFELEVAFDPSDLRDALAEHGEHAVDVEVQRTARHRWLLFLRRRDGQEVMDLRDLEAPLPMERILEASGELRPGESLIARTPCFPRPLLAQLDRRQLDWEAVEATDGSGFVWVGRPS